MDFSMYYLKRSLEELLDAEILSESVGHDFDVREFVKNSKKNSVMEKYVLDFSLKHPSVRRCDVEDSIHEALSKLVRDKPAGSKEALRMLRTRVDELLSEVKKKGKDVKKKMSCLKSVKSFSSKGVDLGSIIGKARGILTSNEKTALELCSSGHSVREMGLIMKMSFPTAWRTLNKALDKVRISHGMKSRHRDKR